LLGRPIAAIAAPTGWIGRSAGRDIDECGHDKTIAKVNVKIIDLKRAVLPRNPVVRMLGKGATTRFCAN
jgi:hypothetical protein